MFVVMILFVYVLASKLVVGSGVVRLVLGGGTCGKCNESKLDMKCTKKFTAQVLLRGSE